MNPQPGQRSRSSSARSPAAAAAAQLASVQAARAAAPPVPASAPVAAGSVQDIITQAFAPYGQAAVSWGLRVAKCESGYNPRAYTGAGWLVALCGDMQTMPGLGRSPAAHAVDIDDQGRTVGLF